MVLVEIFAGVVAGHGHDQVLGWVEVERGQTCRAVADRGLLVVHVRQADAPFLDGCRRKFLGQQVWQLLCEGFFTHEA